MNSLTMTRMLNVTHHLPCSNVTHHLPCSKIRRSNVKGGTVPCSKLLRSNVSHHLPRSSCLALKVPFKVDTTANKDEEEEEDMDGGGES